MTKKKRNGLPISGQFTPILNELQDSQAYLKLSGNAVKLHTFLVRVARTVAVKTGAANECLPHFDYTYTEARKRGFAESTFKRAIKELWELGFINVVAIGGRTVSKGGGRSSSRYQLSGYWKTYGKQWQDRTKIEQDPWLPPQEPKSGDKGNW